MPTKAERTKQFIIEKTAPVFNEKGYAGTSMNDLVEATGLTKGSIYGNFENKDEVALAAFDHNFGQVVTYIRSRMETCSNAIDRLLVYPGTYRNFLQLSFLKAGCPLLNTSVEADDTHPLLREKAVNALNFWKASVERIITSGIERKEIKAKTNVAHFAVILMSLIEGAVMQAKLKNSSAELEITMDYLETLIRDLKK
ncbi:MAG: transcriptional regulator [Crocinitomicaceae bacterium]|jgi:AcrR family transcriptional regulator|nr:transcriptional regulator [Crocinitomicaceae bacterium]